MRLYLNAGWAEIANKVDLVEAMRIAVNREPIPDSWIDILSIDKREQFLWKASELKAGEL